MAVRDCAMVYGELVDRLHRHVNGASSFQAYQAVSRRKHLDGCFFHLLFHGLYRVIVVFTAGIATMIAGGFWALRVYGQR